MKDVQFEQTRTVLRVERGDLKRNRKFKKPNASAALFEEEIQVLFEKKTFWESTTAEASLNSLWFHITINLRLRSRLLGEMCWGDVILCYTSIVQEYLQTQ